jgi:hypothetical protein
MTGFGDAISFWFRLMETCIVFFPLLEKVIFFPAQGLRGPAFQPFFSLGYLARIYVFLTFMQVNYEGPTIFFIIIYSVCYKHFQRFVGKYDKKWGAAPAQDRQQTAANKNENHLNTDCCEQIELLPSVPPKNRAASPHPHRDPQGNLAQPAGIEGSS